MTTISCLIDTNIFLQFEEEDQGSGTFKSDFAEVFRLCQKHSIQLYCHPSSIDDIKRDRNLVRQKRTLSALAKYPILDKPPTVPLDQLEELFGGIGSDNDRVDCQILYALLCNCIDFVVSEDSGVHKRASNTKVNLRHRVFSISEFKSWLKRNFEPQTVELPSVEDLPVYNLDTKDPMFDSLRDSYGPESFDKWMQKCNKEKRRAWVIWNEGRKSLAALCIYNLDSEHSDRIPELGSKPLKLCTFKVSESNRGMKLGELLLKTIFMYAIENKISSCWLTAFGTQQVVLINFLKDFGFHLAGFQNQNQEDILFKSFEVPKNLPEMDPLKFHILYSPNFSDVPEIKKFIIPIIPEYHHLLFPELDENEEEQLDLLPGGEERKIPGHTIKKIYLSHSQTRFLPQGSIIIFYRSQDIKSLTTIGIVEKSHRLSNFSEAIRIIGKRSVYPIPQIEEILKQETLIIEFRFSKHLKSFISYDFLIEKGVLRGPPVSIVEISNDRYLEIKNLL